MPTDPEQDHPKAEEQSNEPQHAPERAKGAEENQKPLDLRDPISQEQYHRELAQAHEFIKKSAESQTTSPVATPEAVAPAVGQEPSASKERLERKNIRGLGKRKRLVRVEVDPDTGHEVNVYEIVKDDEWGELGESLSEQKQKMGWAEEYGQSQAFVGWPQELLSPMPNAPPASVDTSSEAHRQTTPADDRAPAESVAPVTEATTARSQTTPAGEPGAAAANLEAQLELGRWIEKQLGEAEQFSKLVRAGRSPEDLRGNFPEFFSDVIEVLHADTRQQFFKDAKQRRMSHDDLAEVIAVAKNLSGSYLLKLRTQYRKSTHTS